MPPVYLDHAATTPLRPEALEAFVAASAVTGNPSSAHAAGRHARRLLEEAREDIAAALGADPAEVVLTAGGTEADNLAVKGAFWAAGAARGSRAARVLVAAVEHHAVLDAARWLEEHDGAKVVELGVDGAGRLRLEELEAELDAHGDGTALVSVMWANNEVGTIQPVADAARLAAAVGVPLHTDAVQAVGQVAVDFRSSGASALSVSGHKLGAPVGVGALLVRRELGLAPLLHGGGQERGVRSGTVPVAAACALAAAVRAAVAQREEEGARVAVLRDRLVRGLTSVEGVVPRGPAPVGPLDPLSPARPGGAPDRLPGNAHVTVGGADAEVLLFLLDSAGVAASSGSACTAGVEQVSHVLLAMGVSPQDARGAVRFTLGRTTTAADVDAVLAAWPDVVARARLAQAVS